MPDILFTIYHNPRCRKSREALALLKENGIMPKEVRYLDEPLSTDDLRLILAKLHLSAKDIVRTEEADYKKKYKNSNFTEEEWLLILRDEPKLMQRPIVLKGATGVVGRPPENVLKLIK